MYNRYNNRIECWCGESMRDCSEVRRDFKIQKHRNKTVNLKQIFKVASLCHNYKTNKSNKEAKLKAKNKKSQNIQNFKNLHKTKTKVEIIKNDKME